MNHQHPSLGEIDIDLERLMATRMLIQAGSGGGKSWVLRRLVEQTAPHVQQFIIDPEGEFVSLREKFDHVICAAKGGDIVINPFAAGKLARALWKSGCSAVLDISELPADQRHVFLHGFFNALIMAPRDEWHAAMVVVDEAATFAPQQGGTVALQAMIDMATRGRKRGLSLVCAVQRVSRLNKDVAAELGNRLIGRTTLDVDIARAADEMGMRKADATEKLRALRPGQFYAFGPALVPSVTLTTIGKVETIHHQAAGGEKIPPRPAVLEKISQIEGVQVAVEEEEQTVESLRAEVARLREGAEYPTPEAYEAVCEARTKWQARAEEAETTLDAVRAALGEAAGNYQVIIPAGSITLEMAGKMKGHGKVVPLEDDWAERARMTGEPGDNPLDSYQAKLGHGPGQKARDDRHALSEPRKRILDALMALEGMGVPAPTRATLGAFAGASPRSSAYVNNLGGLRSAGLLDYPGGGLVAITAEGRNVARIARKHYTLDDLHAAWLGILTKPQQRILMVLIRERKSHGMPISVSREFVAHRAEASEKSSAFINNLGAMRALGCVIYPQSGELGVSEILFPKGLK